ncbi:MAG: hypothetical protein BGP03_28800 [Pseudonocardia sp. 73-21]|nr:MAG: hypothetical protein BGP03_28800 [Pseudonocardia sp. 73-21]
MTMHPFAADQFRYLQDGNEVMRPLAAGELLFLEMFSRAVEVGCTTHLRDLHDARGDDNPRRCSAWT